MLGFYTEGKRRGFTEVHRGKRSRKGRKGGEVLVKAPVGLGFYAEEKWRSHGVTQSEKK